MALTTRPAVSVSVTDQSTGAPESVPAIERSRPVPSVENLSAASPARRVSAVVTVPSDA